MLWSRLRGFLHPADSEVREHLAEVFTLHFESKVDRIRSSTAKLTHLMRRSVYMNH